MADVVEGCWYCEHGHHKCSGCGVDVEHDEPFCAGCRKMMYGDEG